MSCKNFIFKFLFLLFLLSLSEKDLFSIRRGIRRSPQAVTGNIKKANDVLSKLEAEIARASGLLKKFNENRYDIESGFKDKKKELGKLIESVPDLKEKLGGGDTSGQDS